MSLPVVEFNEKKRTVEKQRGKALLLWHRQLAEELRLEDWTRCLCNDELTKFGFAPVLPKKAARVRDAGIEEGMGHDEILARVWYAMSDWQSEFAPMFSE